MDKTGITIASAATGTYNMIIEAAKGEVARTENISKEEMIKRLDTIFLQNSDDEYKASVKKLFSPCKKGASIISPDGKYELKTFIIGWYSKYLNLRSSRIWIYDKETNVCYECKAWAMKKVVKFVKRR